MSHIILLFALLALWSDEEFHLDCRMYKVHELRQWVFSILLQNSAPGWGMNHFIVKETVEAGQILDNNAKSITERQHQVL